MTIDFEKDQQDAMKKTDRYSVSCRSSAKTRGYATTT